MTTYIKGLDLSALNPVHQAMLDLFVDEHESRDIERIDKVEVIDDYSIRIYTSQFIGLGQFRSSSALRRHLQLMSTYRAYDNDPDPDVQTMNDPYCDFEMDRRYREVAFTSVYRTLEGDQGWINSRNDDGTYEYEEDVSDLHLWAGRI